MCTYVFTDIHLEAPRLAYPSLPLRSSVKPATWMQTYFKSAYIYVYLCVCVYETGRVALRGARSSETRMPVSTRSRWGYIHKIICSFICIFRYINIYVYIYIHVCVYKWNWTCRTARRSNLRDSHARLCGASVRLYTCMYIYVNVCVYICIFIYTCIYIYTYVREYIYMYVSVYI